MADLCCGPEIPTDNQIVSYFHCKVCLEEMVKLAAQQGSAKPILYTRYGVGLTPLGIQVVCHRHHLNVVHVSFDGYKLPANMHE